MKIIIAPDSFKGSLQSSEIIEIISEVFSREFDTEIIGMPLADGGEGTIEAILAAKPGRKYYRKVLNPLGIEIESHYAVVDQTAFIEMANCSGLTLIDANMRNPLKTTTYGTGQMIKHALDDGFRHIIIAIGGSATNDGGAGMLEALGAVFTPGHIKHISGELLGILEQVELSGLDPRLEACHIEVMCDVDNPLTGERGATRVYGEQKGGSFEVLEQLEENMLRYQNLFEGQKHKIAGAGAAGGLGYAFLQMDAELKSGIEMMLDLYNFSDQVKNADLIITGEGRIDSQSIQGKVLDGLLNYASGIPIIAFTGGVGKGYEAVLDKGVTIVTLPNRPMTLSQAMKETPILLREGVKRICSILKLDMKKANDS